MTDWISIPACKFLMGSSHKTHPGIEPSSEPIRQVHLSPYKIMRAPVTIQHWKVFLRETGFEWEHVSEVDRLSKNNSQCPITFVSWEDCQHYVEWMNNIKGAGHALPTEAQWENACRGPCGSIFPWHADNSDERDRIGIELFGNDQDLRPIASFPDLVSGYGCLDMWCNIGEWCTDWLSNDGYDSLLDQLVNPTGVAGGDYRAVRGGNGLDSGFPHCTHRSGEKPHVRHRAIGMRLVKNI